VGVNSVVEGNHLHLATEGRGAPLRGKKGSRRETLSEGRKQHTEWSLTYVQRKTGILQTVDAKHEKLLYSAEGKEKKEQR